VSYVSKGDLVLLRKGIFQDWFPKGELALVVGDVNEAGKAQIFWRNEKTWVYFEDLVVVSRKTS